MTQPAPGLLAHIEQWVQEHVAPDIAAIRQSTATVLTFCREHAANASELADLVVKLAGAADPAAAPAIAALVADAERIAAEAARIAGNITGGTGM